MTRPCRICVVGSANVDLTFRTPRLPRAGETLAGHSLHIGMGGKGANQAVAAARLGAEVAFVARAGNDTLSVNEEQPHAAPRAGRDSLGNGKAERLANASTEANGLSDAMRTITLVFREFLLISRETSGFSCERMSL